MRASRGCGGLGSSRGLTFIELLVAATMMSLLFVGLTGHLQGGVRVWQRATTTTEALQRQRVAMDRLERDMAMAIVFPSNDEDLKAQFDANHLRVWTLSASTPRAIGQLQLVEYACETREGVEGLWRSSRSLRNAPDPSLAAEALVMPGCGALTFRYGYKPPQSDKPVAWYDTWEYPEDLPRVVEAVLRMTGGDEIRRTILIPVGVRKDMPQQPA